MPKQKKKNRKSPAWLAQSLREIVVLIIGILLSLWISNIFQNGKDNERAKIYLTRLQTDLTDDLAQLESELQQRQLQIESAGKIIAALNQEEPNGLRNVMFTGVQRLLWTIRFSSKNATFRSLESTGDLRLIQNDSIVNGILDLYRNAYDRLRDNNDDITKYRDNFLLPYIIENLEFKAAFNPSPYAPPMEIRNLDELYNHMTYLSISLTSTVEAYEINLAVLRNLKDKIDRELSD